MPDSETQTEIQDADENSSEENLGGGMDRSVGEHDSDVVLNAQNRIYQKRTSDKMTRIIRKSGRLRNVV